MKRVLDIYNMVADQTGFPRYTNETDTPETNRFILNMITLGLHNVIDGVYLSNNILERTDKIITTVGKQEYTVNGIVKNLQYKDRDGKFRDIPYNNKINKHDITDQKGEPKYYVINKGRIKLYDIPDDNYELIVTVATTQLVISDNDSNKVNITSVNDSILGDEEFCNLVALRAISLIFAKCNNANAQIYMQLTQERLKTYIEQDMGSLQAKRGFIDRSGYYNSRDGLL